MASRRFLGYDPYDYYYPDPYRYTYPYYQHQPGPARSGGGFFPAGAEDAVKYYSYRHEPAIPRNAGGFCPSTGNVDPYYQPATARSSGGFFPAAGNVEPAAARAAVRPEAGVSRSVSIPVRFVSSDQEPEVARMPVKRAPSAAAAAVLLQAAARGFLARRAVRALRAVEREVEEVARKVAREAEKLQGDARARIAVGEALMRLLLRLDAVRFAREYRRRVTNRVLALQDTVDALEQRPASVAVAEEAMAAAAETTTVDMAEENAVAADLPASGENNSEMEDKMAAEVAAGMEVHGDRAAAEETEPTQDGANLGGDKPADEAVEVEWEMVAGEPVAAVPAALYAPQPQAPSREETTTRPAEVGGADGGVGTKKLMEMVAALCEQSAQQCAVIGALAERVDALERAVRRVEDAERRRRRAKKLRKEGKGSYHIKCYSD